MEHRRELEQILLNGLPEQERRHVVNVMRQMTAEKLRRMQSETAADNELIDITELEFADDDY